LSKNKRGAIGVDHLLSGGRKTQGRESRRIAKRSERGLGKDFWGIKKSQLRNRGGARLEKKSTQLERGRQRERHLTKPGGRKGGAWKRLT